MQWNELKKTVDVVAAGGTGNPLVVAVSADSRTVTPGCLYVAVPGYKVDGESFIADACERGAVAILSARVQNSDTPWAVVADVRHALGVAAAAVYKTDLTKLCLVGITGTNGKTTTAHLFEHLCVSRFGRAATWMVGTIEYHFGETVTAAPNTTPLSADIFRRMGEAVLAPAALVMEVSSHSLVQNRNAGLRFDCAVFTNLTQDHLDFHKTMEEYYQAKKLLFTNHLKSNGKAVINIDDEYGMRLSGELPALNTVTVGRCASARVRIVHDTSTWEGTSITLLIDGCEYRFFSPLCGGFNVYNLAGFCAGAWSLGFSINEIAECCRTMKTVCGRMDRVAIAACFTVVVDYAHTPDALENVLKTARTLTAGRLLCVFGCGGDRDRTKRSLMAAAVAAHVDEAIITSDNPRSEDPLLIIREIAQGIPADFPHWVIADRKSAIAKAMSMARADDCIVIAGKGHEEYQEIHGVRHHFNDREVVQEIYTASAAGRNA